MAFSAGPHALSFSLAPTTAQLRSEKRKAEAADKALAEQAARLRREVKTAATEEERDK